MFRAPIIPADWSDDDSDGVVAAAPAPAFTTPARTPAPPAPRVAPPPFSAPTPPPAALSTPAPAPTSTTPPLPGRAPSAPPAPAAPPPVPGGSPDTHANPHDTLSPTFAAAVPVEPSPSPPPHPLPLRSRNLGLPAPLRIPNATPVHQKPILVEENHVAVQPHLRRQNSQHSPKPLAATATLEDQLFNLSPPLKSLAKEGFTGGSCCGAPPIEPEYLHPGKSYKAKANAINLVKEQRAQKFRLSTTLSHTLSTLLLLACVVFPGVMYFIGDRDNSLDFFFESRTVMALLGLAPLVLAASATAGLGIGLRIAGPLALLLTLGLGMLFFQCTCYIANDEANCTVDQFCLQSAEAAACTNTTTCSEVAPPVGDWSPSQVFVPVALGKSLVDATDALLWAILEYTFSAFGAMFFLRVLEMWGVVPSIVEQCKLLVAVPVVLQITVVALALNLILSFVIPGGICLLITGRLLVELADDDEETRLGHTIDSAEHVEQFEPQMVAEKNRTAVGRVMLLMFVVLSPFSFVGLPVSTMTQQLRDLPVPGNFLFTETCDVFLDQTVACEEAPMNTVNASTACALSHFGESSDCSVPVNATLLASLVAAQPPTVDCATAASNFTCALGFGSDGACSLSSNDTTCTVSSRRVVSTPVTLSEVRNNTAPTVASSERQLSQLYAVAASGVNLFMPLVLAKVGPVPSSFKYSFGTYVFLLSVGVILAGMPLLMAAAGPETINFFTGVVVVVWGLGTRGSNFFWDHEEAQEEVEPPPPDDEGDGVVAEAKDGPEAKAGEEETKEQPGGGEPDTGGGVLAGVAGSKSPKNQATVTFAKEEDGSQRGAVEDSAENNGGSLLDKVPPGALLGLLVPILCVATVLLALSMAPNRDEHIGTTNSGDSDVLSPVIFRIHNAAAGRVVRQFSWIHRGLILIIFALLAPAISGDTTSSHFHPHMSSLGILRNYMAPMRLSDAPWSYTNRMTKIKFVQAVERNAVGRMAALYRMMKNSIPQDDKPTPQFYRLVWQRAFKLALQDSSRIILVMGSLVVFDRLAFRYGLWTAVGSWLVTEIGEKWVIALAVPCLGFVMGAVFGSPTLAGLFGVRIAGMMALSTNADGDALITASYSTIYEVGAVFMLGACVGMMLSPQATILVSMIPGVKEEPLRLGLWALPFAMVMLGVAIVASLAMLDFGDGGLHWEDRWDPQWSTANP